MCPIQGAEWVKERGDVFVERWIAIWKCKTGLQSQCWAPDQAGLVCTSCSSSGNNTPVSQTR